MSCGFHTACRRGGWAEVSQVFITVCEKPVESSVILYYRPYKHIGFVEACFYFKWRLITGYDSFPSAIPERDYPLIARVGNGSRRLGTL